MRALRELNEAGAEAAETSTVEQGITHTLGIYRNIVVAVDSMTASEEWRCVGALEENKAGGGVHPSRRIYPVESTRLGSAAWPRQDAALRSREVGRPGDYGSREEPMDAACSKLNSAMRE